MVSGQSQIFSLMKDRVMVLSYSLQLHALSWNPTHFVQLQVLACWSFSFSAFTVLTYIFSSWIWIREIIKSFNCIFLYLSCHLTCLFCRHASAPCAYASCIAQTRDNMGLSETWGSIHDVTVQHVPEQHLISGLGPREEYHFRRVQAAWGWVIVTVQNDP